MIDPENIPQFTGDLEQLESDASGLKADGGNIAKTGKGIHSSFQGLSAFYDAPEAERLFATTKPVADTAETFGGDLETVASALSEYAHEVRPIATKLEQLKIEATTFVADVKSDDDWQDNWKYDGDKVSRNNDLLHQVDAAVAAFWEAERKAANRIDKIFHGTQYVANDGSDKSNMYGYTSDQLDHGKLPWGSSEEESHHWWEAGYWVKSFVWDGLIVDGVWGTLKGLGGLVGLEGGDVFVQSWKGLGKLAIGVGSYVGIPVLAPLMLAVPDSWLPGFVQDGRKTAREAGKSLLAWDEWSHNPARAAGAVTFNALTILAGGEGAIAKAGEVGKFGGVAKVANMLAKTGRVIDPMTYVFKGLGKLPKVSEVAAALNKLTTSDLTGLDDLTRVHGVDIPDGSLKLSDDSVLHTNNEVHVPDGEVKTPAHVESPKELVGTNAAHGSHDLVNSTMHRADHDIAGADAKSTDDVHNSVGHRTDSGAGTKVAGHDHGQSGPDGDHASTADKADPHETDGSNAGGGDGSSGGGYGGGTGDPGDSSAPHDGPDHLAAATTRNVDLDRLGLPPAWRTDDAPLYRNDNRSPDIIFDRGFEPLDPSNTDLKRYVENNDASAFVSTSRREDIGDDFGGKFTYEVDVPGGIDVNETLGPHPLDFEREVAFPGGVRKEFIVGARPYDYTTGDFGDLIPNPHYHGGR